LVFSGGKWRPSDTLSEADAAARYFTELGIADNRIIREGKAGNTW
jgi:uncharacterized SAM-binding protein YcdF (DUF218 family)